jgi:hypothetical protein
MGKGSVGYSERKKYSMGAILSSVTILGVFGLGLYLVVYGCDSVPIYTYNCETQIQSVVTDNRVREKIYTATGNITCNQTFGEYLSLEFTHATLYTCPTMLCRNNYLDLYLSPQGWTGWSYSTSDQPRPDKLDKKSVSAVWCFFGILSVILSGISISLFVILICCTIYRDHLTRKRRAHTQTVEGCSDVTVTTTLPEGEEVN